MTINDYFKKNLSNIANLGGGRGRSYRWNEETQEYEPMFPPGSLFFPETKSIYYGGPKATKPIGSPKENLPPIVEKYRDLFGQPSADNPISEQTFIDKYGQAEGAQRWNAYANALNKNRLPFEPIPSDVRQQPKPGKEKEKTLPIDETRKDRRQQPEQAPDIKPRLRPGLSFQEWRAKQNRFWPQIIVEGINGEQVSYAYNEYLKYKRLNKRIKERTEGLKQLPIPRERTSTPAKKPPTPAPKPNVSGYGGLNRTLRRGYGLGGYGGLNRTLRQNYGLNNYGGLNNTFQNRYRLGGVGGSGSTLRSGYGIGGYSGSGSTLRSGYGIGGYGGSGSTLRSGYGLNNYQNQYNRRGPNWGAMI